MLPNLIIIGAQKSATTFIQECLAEHPDVFLPEGETAFFETPDYDESSLKALERIFDGRTEKVLGIKRPSYIGRPEVPKRIEKTVPDAKLIAVLRNPIDRALSAYFHNVAFGFLPPLAVEKGMRKILGDSVFRNMYKRSGEVLEYGKYFKYLSLYESYFKERKIIVMLHDDIEKDPVGSLRKIYKFLDIRDFDSPSSLGKRPQKVVYNIKRLTFLRLRSFIQYEYNKERTRLFPRTPGRVGKVGVSIINCLDAILSRLVVNDKPRLSNELRSLLWREYKDDVDGLQDLICRDLSIWTPK